MLELFLIPRNTPHKVNNSKLDKDAFFGGLPSGVTNVIFKCRTIILDVPRIFCYFVLSLSINDVTKV